DLSAAPALHELLKQESNEDVGGLASFGHAAKLPGELRHPGLEELQLIDRLSESVEHVPKVGFIIAALALEAVRHTFDEIRRFQQAGAQLLRAQLAQAGNRLAGRKEVGGWPILGLIDR